MAEVDVVVIGAGFSGLTAATELAAAGARVRVMEAAGRVGGRALTVESGLGSAVDLGGQWVSPLHTEVRALSAKYGVTLFKSYDVGRQTALDSGRPISLRSLTGLGVAAGLSRLALGMHFGVGVRDDRSLEDWLRGVRPEQARRLLEVLLCELTCQPASEISIAAVTEMFASSGGIREMLTVAGGAQDSLFAGGAQQLAELMATTLGDAIALDRRVTLLDRDDRGVEVHTAVETVRAAHVIVASAPPVAAAIDHHPHLPVDRAAVQRHTVMGAVYKAVAVYDRPFWRDAGCDGQLLVLDGAIRSAFDVSPPDGPGHLCVLVPAAAARRIGALEESVRRRSVLDELSEHFGSRVLTPVSFHEKIWQNDEFVLGGYNAAPKIGYLGLSLNEQERPTGRVHWAGTENSKTFTGYLEGAVRSGRHAASDVMAQL